MEARTEEPVVVEHSEVALPHDAAVPVPDASSEAIPEKESDFVDLQSLMPSAQLDMRYAGTNNFVGKAIYPKARCLLRRPVALALKAAQASLEREGLQVLIWDCYRPFSVQEHFWQLVPDSRYVAQPIRHNGELARGSKHNRGAAIDLGVIKLDGTPVALPTDHDDFSARAHHNALGVSAEARGNAQHLRRAMESAGFDGIKTEWWHFDHQSWRNFSLSDEPL